MITKYGIFQLVDLGIEENKSRILEFVCGNKTETRAWELVESFRKGFYCVLPYYDVIEKPTKETELDLGTVDISEGTSDSKGNPDLALHTFDTTNTKVTLNSVSSKPIIVTLCGSTKFKQAFIDANRRETMAGKIVLSVSLFGHADKINLTEEEKTFLDELHKRKIDISSEILVLNVGGYIGESTQSEIKYAHLKGKSINYWEKE